MNYEERELLLTDLCARLPYGVQGITSGGIVSPLIVKGEADWDILTSLNYRIVKHGWKPFLRPLSSMTEEEKSYVQQCIDIVEAENYGDSYSPAAWDAMSDFTNYCYERHLDLHGLIPKGLALEAPEGMYNTKTE